MRKSHILFVALAIFATQPLFAFGKMDSKPCGMVAKACVDAGFTRDADSAKEFWHNCMKPVLLDEKVEGVTIDADIVKNCRTDKIAQMKKDLSELEKVKSKK